MGHGCVPGHGRQAVPMALQVGPRVGLGVVGRQICLHIHRVGHSAFVVGVASEGHDQVPPPHLHGGPCVPTPLLRSSGVTYLRPAQDVLVAGGHQPLRGLLRGDSLPPLRPRKVTFTHLKTHDRLFVPVQARQGLAHADEGLGRDFRPDCPDAQAAGGGFIPKGCLAAVQCLAIGAQVQVALRCVRGQDRQQVGVGRATRLIQDSIAFQDGGGGGVCPDGLDVPPLVEMCIALGLQPIGPGLCSAAGGGGGRPIEQRVGLAPVGPPLGPHPRGEAHCHLPGLPHGFKWRPARGKDRHVDRQGSVCHGVVLGLVPLTTCAGDQPVPVNGHGRLQPSGQTLALVEGQSGRLRGAGCAVQGNPVGI
mmetsp:Transcript_133813/g.232162  ORF Transcript_133813/g.232162 Transcript_133813/m.232162 type:complete len:363 (-) Transcript_133813:433-1521(-)